MTPGDPARHGDRQPARHPAGRRRCRSPRSSPTALEKKVSRYRDELGKGAIEGVAAPEAANNAAAQTAFIPTLTLGIPGSATMALMLGAMVMHSIQPGPQVMTSNPELFWGLIAIDVDRQPDAGHPQPAAGRALGEAAEDPLSARSSRRSCCSAASASTALEQLVVRRLSRGRLRRRSATCFASSSASRRR